MSAIVKIQEVRRDQFVGVYHDNGCVRMDMHMADIIDFFAGITSIRMTPDQALRLACVLTDAASAEKQKGKQ